MIRVLLDTNVLSEPLREHPHPFVLDQLRGESYQLHTASVVIHELAYGIQRLPSGRKRRRLTVYLDGLLDSGLRVLPYDRQAALWHAEQRALLEAEGRRPAFVDSQIAAIAATNDLVMVTRNISDFADFKGLQLLNWFA